MSHPLLVGVDPHRKTNTVCTMDRQGREAGACFTVENNRPGTAAFVRQVAQPATEGDFDAIHVAAEATGWYWWHFFQTPDQDPLLNQWPLTLYPKGDLQPHRWRYWLTPSEDPDFEVKVDDICELYREVPVLAEQGERVMNSDELSGVQALERKHPGLPMAPGKVERIEFEYIRHGTCTFTFSRDVLNGQVLTPGDSTTRRGRFPGARATGRRFRPGCAALALCRR